MIDTTTAPTQTQAAPSMQGMGRIEETGPNSFRIVCGCLGNPILEVEGCGEGYWSYNLRHGFGGLHVSCRACFSTYALASRVEGVGLPDLIDLDLLDHSALSPLSPTALHLLDTSLMVDDACWEKSVDLVRAASTERKAELETAALLIRGHLQRRKIHTVRVISWEFGIDRFPPGTRLFRAEGGAGYVWWPEGAKPCGILEPPRNSSPHKVPEWTKTTQTTQTTPRS